MRREAASRGVAARYGPARALGRAAAWVAAAVLVGSCASTGPSAGSPDLANTAWLLASLAGRAPVLDAMLTMRFEGGLVHGTNGCNRYAAPYTTTGPALRIETRAAATQMGCERTLTAQADAYMRALADARGWRVAGDELQLIAAGGAVLAVFRRQPQRLGGTSWRVARYNNGRQAVVTVVPATTLTIIFSNDGILSGSGGCNRYTTAYTGDEKKLRIAPVVTQTRMTCAAPEGVMEQEQRFLATLPTVASARFEGDRLELRTADGALAIALTREGAP